MERYPVLFKFSITRRQLKGLLYRQSDLTPVLIFVPSAYKINLGLRHENRRKKQIQNRNHGRDV